MAFTFYHFGRGQYVGFNGNRKFKAIITRDEFGKRHLEIIDRALCVKRFIQSTMAVLHTNASGPLLKYCLVCLRQVVIFFTTDGALTIYI